MGDFSRNEPAEDTESLSLINCHFNFVLDLLCFFTVIVRCFLCAFVYFNSFCTFFTCFLLEKLELRLYSVPFVSPLACPLRSYLKHPSDWSKAIIVPIYKLGNRCDPLNYRGIALQCTL